MRRPLSWLRGTYCNVASQAGRGLIKSSRIYPTLALATRVGRLFRCSALALGRRLALRRGPGARAAGRRRALGADALGDAWGWGAEERHRAAHDGGPPSELLSKIDIGSSYLIRPVDSQRWIARAARSAPLPSTPQVVERIIEIAVTSRARAITASRWRMSRSMARACSIVRLTRRGCGQSGRMSFERKEELGAGCRGLSATTSPINSRLQTGSGSSLWLVSLQRPAWM